MQTPESVEHDIRQLFQQEQLAVLSTEQNGQPYVSLVAYAATADLQTIIFCTPITTRKYNNLSANPRVAMLINNSRNQASDVYSAVAVTAIGSVVPVTDSDRDDLENLYLQKHPHLMDFLRTRTTALVRVRIERYIMVHNFQNVYDYRVKP
jgi:nitroimidazol reductase NimA-like FMN-containing flavoprotein (pyridoxamine 5'-phosphate oxidase superfamily)